MSKYVIKSAAGEQVGEAELSSDVFGIEPNIPVIHEVVVCQAASQRQESQSLSTSPVRGGRVVAETDRNMSGWFFIALLSTVPFPDPDGPERIKTLPCFSKVRSPPA